MSKPAADPKRAPPCPHWDECGGCPLIRYDYPEQLSYKGEKVFKAFLEHGFGETELRRALKPTKSSPKTMGYRNKAKWILQSDGLGGLKMGIYAPGTHDVVDIPHCVVHAPAINEVSAFIKSELIRLKVACGHEASEQPKLRYVIVRYSFRDKKVITVFVTTHSKVPRLDQLFGTLTQQFGERITAIVQNINSDAGNVLLGEANRFVRKNGELTETLGRFRVPVGPLSFVQVNSLQAAYLYKRVRELIGEGPFEAGLDLYSGVGLFALHLASTTKKILAVEEVGPAALEAMTAARRSRIPNVLQLCGDALEGVSVFAGEWGTPDWVVLNPPRKGCEEAVLQVIAAKAPHKLAYVSCNPSTLARDIAVLRRECPSLVLKTIEPVDMFPQTEHVECIALLENKNFRRSTGKVSKGTPPKKKLH